MSHESYITTPDQNGNRHWASIDAWSKAKRMGVTQYKAKLKSDRGMRLDDRDGAVVRATFRRANSTEEWATCLHNMAQVVSDFAKRFNLTSDDNRRITVLVPQVASLESRSRLDNSRQEGEYFILEEKLKSSHVQTFVWAGEKISGPANNLVSSTSKCGSLTPVTPLKDVNNNYLPGQRQSKYAWMNNLQWNKGNMYTQPAIVSHLYPALPTEPSLEEEPPAYTELPTSQERGRALVRLPYKTLHSFVHHFYQYHQGKMAVDFLQGIFNYTKGYTLTQPTVHSLDGQFGQQDQGRDGVWKVVQAHRCNQLCAHLPCMEAVFLSHENESVFNQK